MALHARPGFEGVMRKCAEPRPAGDHLDHRRFHCCYTDLHGGARSQRRGLREGRAGGRLYGVSIGASSEANRCSIAAPMLEGAVVYLVQHLRQRGFVLLDGQVPTPIWRSWAGRIRVTSSSHDCNRLLPFRSRSDRAQGMVGYHAPSCPCGGMPVHSRGEPVGFAGGAPSREGLARPSEASGWGGRVGRRQSQPFEGSHISGGGRLRGFVALVACAKPTLGPHQPPQSRSCGSSYPHVSHDPHAFTQGLLFFEGKFYEAPGSTASSLRGWIRTAAWSSAGSTSSGSVWRGLARSAAPVSIDLAEPARAGLEPATLHKEREISYQARGGVSVSTAAISS